MKFKELVEEKKYDSTKDTKAHIERVAMLLKQMVTKLEQRAKDHDASKLEDPEKSTFDDATSRLKKLTYGSDEYKAQLELMAPALKHHYENNRHHPEHFDNGILGMDLVDLFEMICDWKAATERHSDGDIVESINKNQKRFKYSDDVKEILLNTIKNLE